MWSVKQISRKLLLSSDYLLRYRKVWPWLALFLALALVAGFGWPLIRYVERQDRQALQLQAVELASGIEQRMESSEAMLRASSTAFAFVPVIDGDFFSSYIKGLGLQSGYEGLVGMGWTVPVARERIPALEARMRAEGRADFFVWPVMDSRMNYAILYLEPENSENSAAIGFNMFSESTRRAAMLRAFTDNQPRASGPVRLQQNLPGDVRSGFLLYAPVFDAVRQEGGEAPRRFGLRGYIYAAFRTADLVHSIIPERNARRIDMELYDVTDRSPQLLYDSRPEIWSLKKPGGIITDLSVGGRHWQLVVAPIYGWQFSNFPQRMLIYFLLATGLIVCLLLASLVWLMLESMSSSKHALDRQAEQIRIRNILVRELNHRVKNTLATVNSLAALSREGVSDVSAYYEALSGRLRALSATHDLLTSSEWGETELRDIAEAELAPFRSGKGQVRIEGPPIRFDPTKALSLGLSLHELATNASKYGALSTPGGRVSLSWQVRQGTLLLNWVETGGPKVKAKRKNGFGSVLIEKLMARQLKAKVKIGYLPEGVVCAFEIPLEPLPASR